MRCLALAQAWRQRGGEVVFLSHSLSDSLQSRIISMGARFVSVAAPHPDSLDLDITLRELESSPSSWLVLDGYHFDANFPQRVRLAGHKVLLFDDYNHLPSYSADILLNQNLGAEQLAYSCPPETLLLLGSRYALLRPEFTLQSVNRTTPRVVRRILVTLGGSDPDNVTLKVLQALNLVDLEGVEIAVVVGIDNPHWDFLNRVLSEGFRHRVRFLKNPSNMAELMAWADLAVAAAGSTCWELAFMGLPSVTVIVSENQRGVATHLHEAGATFNLGWHGQVTPARLGDVIHMLCTDSTQRSIMSQVCRNLIRGSGAAEVLDVVVGVSGRDTSDPIYRLRNAIPDDAVAIWRLANDPLVRGNSFNPVPIPLDAHLRWYQGQLELPNARFWVLEVGGALVAQIRLEKCDSDTAEVHFAVSPVFRGRGFASLVIVRAWERARAELGVNQVVGFVLPSNIPSRSAFLKAGFVEDGTVDRYGQSCMRFRRRCEC